MTLKFTTYDYSKYGGLNGALMEISPFTLKKEGEAGEEDGYFRGIVGISKNYLGGKKGVNSIFPGMTLSFVDSK